MPTLANMTDGSWSYPPVARMLHTPALMSRHIAAIVSLADRENYAGIDIDYEGLHAGDRQALSTFITRLAAALHAHGKILSVAVFAKTSDAGYGGQNVAQDYAAIGRAADQVRRMAYDYHWNTSAPGPIAPISWVRSVIDYARTQIPAARLVLGIPLYGYDWPATAPPTSPPSRRSSWRLSTGPLCSTTRPVSRSGSGTPIPPGAATKSGSRTRAVPPRSSR